MKNVTKKKVKKPIVAQVADKVAKKATAKKKQIAKKKSSAKKPAAQKKVELISYSIKMVIPTGEYANIQPEIVVKAGTPEEAEAYIAPHMNKLWKEYYMVSTRVNVEKPVTKAPEAPKAASKPAPEAPKASKTAVAEQKAPVADEPVPPAPTSAVAFHKASQAIASCTSKEALDLIAGQVEKSVKLTAEEKTKLKPVIEEKYTEFDGEDGE